MEIKEQKKELRKKIRAVKNEYSLDKKKELSEGIFSRVESTEEFINAECVLLYWSMDDEVFTHGFIDKWYGKKVILLPCVAGDDLVLRKYEGRQSMVAGEQFGIAEPTGSIYDDYASVDLMIIPGVAFDAAKNRMGRGRGFYDRLLKTCKCKKMGVCFDFQLVPTVPSEEFDVKMDCVVTSSRIY